MVWTAGPSGRLTGRQRHDVDIQAYPFWSLIIIAVDVVALYALCVYGSRANIESA
jgi:hypothetical protein